MKKSTPWITIAEETLHTPVSGEKPARAAGTTKTPGSVRHKFFWGVGFAMVVLVSFAMVAPQQFNTLIQGNLFDAPGVTAPELTQVIQPLGILPTGTSSAETTPEPEAIVPVNETVVQPETAPVDVQVKPVTAPADETQPTEEADANQRLLEELRKQVEDLKTENEMVLPPLAPPLEPYGSEFRPSAPEAAGVTAALGQIPAAQGPYRLNPYRVTVLPEQVLQQNLAYRQAGLGGGYVTSYPPAVATPYAPQAYQVRTDLTRVQGTPGSGPREMIALALALTFFGLLVWKGVRLSRS